MSEKNITVLPELLEAFTVEIPIMQRDYVQGRSSKHARVVRTNLLIDIKNAVLEKTTLDLSFIYGKTMNGKFIPVDGQQRLTTLFLLYLYAFREDASKTELLQNFTYKTRITSRKFLKKLILHRSAVFAGPEKPSFEIEDSSWFVQSWKRDPTVHSVLVMLDALVQEFSEVADLAERLMHQNPAPVTFQFQEMQDLGMEDSLYIKLNARGKPLTDLENFKAQLLGRMKELQFPLIREFEHCFDGKWTDFFWKHANGNFDEIYNAFFGVLLMNQGILQDDKNWIHTLDFKQIDRNLFYSAYHTLNFWCTDASDIQAEALLLPALQENRTYTHRVLFHVVSRYLLETNGIIQQTSMDAWIRILKNLILNTEIDNSQRYRRAIEGIDRLAKDGTDLLNYFAQKKEVTGFNQEQIEEERIKASIITADPQTADKILEAEGHPYFSGQIRSALYLARDEHGGYNEKVFSHYWSILSALFDSDKPKYGHLLRRALLTLGDYTLPVSQFRTLCVDDPNEMANTPGLKTLFSRCGNITKKLLDQLDPKQDIKEQLMQLIRTSAVCGTDWRYCFICYPELFGRMSVRHLRLRRIHQEMLMIPNKWANGHNYDVFLSALWQELKNRGISSEFDNELGTSAQHWLSVKDMTVTWSDGKFRIKDNNCSLLFTSTTDDPIPETAGYLENLKN